MSSASQNIQTIQTIQTIQPNNSQIVSLVNGTQIQVNIEYIYNIVLYLINYYKYSKNKLVNIPTSYNIS